MPGKVNPTQCEAIVMICIQVMGDDAAVAFAGSQGNFELNAMRPIIINNFLHSARILGDGCEKFLEFSVEGTTLNTERIDSTWGKPDAGDGAEPGDRLPERRAHRRRRARAGTTLRDAAVASGHVTAEQFDSVVNPIDMVGDGSGGA